ncbi:hypothetical protein Tcan_03050 [Toxocara canis]|uniref:Secreted protein n=1 Tax=Toxocara canis TaxID=6265 RepID=A0A0B2VJ73_TOXCA|nr:hypothetical protein Tcan_03050 [Toxocara canis]
MRQLTVVLATFVLLTPIVCDETSYQLVYSKEDRKHSTTNNFVYNMITKEPSSTSEENAKDVKVVSDEESAVAQFKKLLYKLCSVAQKLWERAKERMWQGIHRLGNIIKEVGNYVKNETIFELMNITRTTMEELDKDSQASLQQRNLH